MESTAGVINEVPRVENEWSDSQTETLKVMWLDGAYLSVIGERLGLSRSAIAGKVSRLRLPKRGRGSERLADSTWDEDKAEILKTMWAAGVQIKVIGRTIGRTPGSVLSKALRLGLPRRNAPIKPPRRPHRYPSAPRPAEPVREIFEGVTYEAPATRKTLLELTERDCRWPCGDPGTADFFFCGAPQDGLSYCREHCAIAYAPTPRLTNARVRYNEAVAA